MKKTLIERIYETHKYWEQGNETDKEFYEFFVGSLIETELPLDVKNEYYGYWNKLIGKKE